LRSFGKSDLQTLQWSWKARQFEVRRLQWDGKSELSGLFRRWNKKLQRMQFLIRHKERPNCLPALQRNRQDNLLRLRRRCPRVRILCLWSIPARQKRDQVQLLLFVSAVLAGACAIIIVPGPFLLPAARLRLANGTQPEVFRGGKHRHTAQDLSEVRPEARLIARKEILGTDPNRRKQDRTVLGRKRREWRTYLWLNEEYLVVLGERRNYYQLITAFCTDRPHTIRKIRLERDAARNG